jgi:hypothetical protein
MFDKPFDEVTKADIDTLIAEGTPEGRELEFKAELPKSGNPKDKGEFAKDVSAFANAVGGYIVYGIAERQDAAGNSTGLYDAVGLPGITKADTEITRLEQMILSNIAPRIYGIRLKAIDGFPQGPVFVLHIPKSWNAPHMVTTDNSRFFSRRNALSMAMDVKEIGSAFLLSAEMPTLIRRFRDERLGRIMAGETPMQLGQGPKVVVHLIPFTSMGVDAGVDLAAVAKSPPSPVSFPGGWNGRFNFDGYVTFVGPGQGIQFVYLQVFRSGAIEAVISQLFSGQDGSRWFLPQVLEQEIFDRAKRCVKFYRAHDVEPPIVIAATLLEFKGATMPSENGIRRLLRPLYPIDRDTLLLPDVLVRDYDTPLHMLMRPTFDALSQAIGLEQSQSYNKDGDWSGDSS